MVKQCWRITNHFNEIFTEKKRLKPNRIRLSPALKGGEDTYDCKK